MQSRRRQNWRVVKHEEIRTTHPAGWSQPSLSEPRDTMFHALYAVTVMRETEDSHTQCAWHNAPWEIDTILECEAFNGLRHVARRFERLLCYSPEHRATRPARQGMAGVSRSESEIDD